MVGELARQRACEIGPLPPSLAQGQGRQLPGIAFAGN
jgi:hypothetical protein